MVAPKSLSGKGLRFVPELGVPDGRAIRWDFAREANCKQRVSLLERVCWRAKCTEFMFIVARTEARFGVFSSRPTCVVFAGVRWWTDEHIRSRGHFQQESAENGNPDWRSRHIISLERMWCVRVRL